MQFELGDFTAFLNSIVDSWSGKQLPDGRSAFYEDPHN
jgi:hypothetical protein